MQITKKIHPRVSLSTLWIIVSINMIFAHIFSVMIELEKGITPDVQGKVESVMIIAAIIINIPIAMIFLTRVLPYKAIRLVNIIVGFLTILYMIGSGSLTTYYIIIAAIEIFVLIMIIIISWQWPDPDYS